MGQKGWARRERDGAFFRNVGNLLDGSVYSYVKWKIGDGEERGDVRSMSVVPQYSSWLTWLWEKGLAGA